MSELAALREAVLAFRDARDWRQFHSLRNLIVSLNLEAGELLEFTQWQSDAEIEALPPSPPPGRPWEKNAPTSCSTFCSSPTGPESIWRRGPAEAGEERREIPGGKKLRLPGQAYLELLASNPSTSYRAPSSAARRSHRVAGPRAVWLRGSRAD